MTKRLLNLTRPTFVMDSRLRGNDESGVGPRFTGDDEWWSLAKGDENGPGACAAWKKGGPAGPPFPDLVCCRIGRSGAVQPFLSESPPKRLLNFATRPPS